MRSALMFACAGEEEREKLEGEPPDTHAKSAHSGGGEPLISAKKKKQRSLTPSKRIAAGGDALISYLSLYIYELR